MSIISLLGNVKEKIPTNYTSEKLFKAADFCLYSALEIIISRTNLVEECLAIYVSTNTRKQIFNSDNSNSEKYIFRFFFEKDLDKKLELLKKMKLNRDLLLLPIKLFAECEEVYCDSVLKGDNKILEIRKALYVKDIEHDLTLDIIKVKKYYKSYLEMREAIIEKYYRLIVTNVGKISPVVKDKIDIEDIAAEYFSATIKAFAKFDIMSGPFTSYLKGWFKNAKSQIFNDEIGVAFLIPSNLRFKIANGSSETNNFSLPLEKFEEVGIESEIDKNQESDDEAIKQIVKMFDSTGIYRLINEMELSINEIVKVK